MNMDKKVLTAVVIGGGIHGLCAAISLANNGYSVSLIEKRDGLLKGTSGSTHNRAHLGYHYPRSIETVDDCKEGLEYFKKKYPCALYHPKEAYYLIEKGDSKTSGEEYKEFCNKANIPYQEVFPETVVINKELFDGCFKVPEPVFDIRILAKLLKEEAEKLNIEILKKSLLIGSKRLANGKYELSYNNLGKQKTLVTDIIINATYAYSNNILKILGLKKYMTKYLLQTTEVVVAKSKIPIPALTIMDGKFISLMPLAGKDNENLLLIYDVLHSVTNETLGYFYDDSKKYESNFSKMISYAEIYYPFIRELKYVKSLWGSRPIPYESAGDQRTTRIVSYKEAPGIYSILEGKFISAPLIAIKLLKKIKQDGY